MATHPRACSTAFERVFMTRRDILQTAHEPFGDAFYYGPERLSVRFADDEEARLKSGFSKSTYKTIMDRLEADGKEGKRVFIKDIAHYLLPPEGTDAHIAKSLVGGHPLTDGHELDSNSSSPSSPSNHTTGTVNGPTDAAVDEEPENPTVMPTDMLRGFHWTFLIRHPRRSIPSYYRCTIPPLDDVTGFHDFMPSEAGYAELRKLFDYLLEQSVIGPARAGDRVPVDEALNSGSGSETSSLSSDAPRRAAITVIDADDLLQRPEAVLRTYCKEVGIDYTPQMLEWGDDDNQQYAAKAFEKWYGFHHDAIESTCLKPRPHGHKTPTVEEEDAEWRKKFGDEAAKTIRETVDANIPHYDYLKSFAIKI